MEQITLRIPENTLESLEGEAEEHGVTRSEHIRDVIESRTEHGEDVDELRNEIEELEAKIEQLEDENEEVTRDLERVKNEKQALIEQREENTELIKYVEQERTAEQQWREAGFTTRLKWKLFGMDSDDNEE